MFGLLHIGLIAALALPQDRASQSALIFFEREYTLAELLGICAHEHGIAIEIDVAKLTSLVHPLPGERYSIERAWQLAQAELAACYRSPNVTPSSVKKRDPLPAAVAAV